MKSRVGAIALALLTWGILHGLHVLLQGWNG